MVKKQEVGTSEGMRIKIKLFSTLQEGRSNKKSHETRPGASTGEVVTELGIPLETPLIIFVNGRHADIDTTLNEGDRLALFPPIGGG